MASMRADLDEKDIKKAISAYVKDQLGSDPADVELVVIEQLTGAEMHPTKKLVVTARVKLISKEEKANR